MKEEINLLERRPYPYIGHVGKDPLPADEWAKRAVERLKALGARFGPKMDRLSCPDEVWSFLDVLTVGDTIGQSVGYECLEFGPDEGRGDCDIHVDCGQGSFHYQVKSIIEDVGNVARIKIEAHNEFRKVLDGPCGRYAAGFITSEGLVLVVYNRIPSLPKGVGAGVLMPDTSIFPEETLKRILRQDVKKASDQLNHLNKDGRGVLVIRPHTPTWAKYEVATFLHEILNENQRHFSTISSAQILDLGKKKKKDKNLKPILYEIWQRKNFPKLTWATRSWPTAGIQFMCLVTGKIKQSGIWTTVGTIDKGYFMCGNKRIGSAFGMVEILKDYQRRIYGRNIS